MESQTFPVDEPLSHPRRDGLLSHRHHKGGHSDLVRQQVFNVGLLLFFFFFKWNQVNLFDFKFVKKAEILIANFNGKKNNFPVPRNIAFCVNSIQTLCLKIH